MYSETVYVRAKKIKPISPSPRNKVGTYVSQAFADSRLTQRGFSAGPLKVALLQHEENLINLTSLETKLPIHDYGTDCRAGEHRHMGNSAQKHFEQEHEQEYKESKHPQLVVARTRQCVHTFDAVWEGAAG